MHIRAASRSKHHSYLVFNNLDQCCPDPVALIFWQYTDDLEGPAIALELGTVQTPLREGGVLLKVLLLQSKWSCGQINYEANSKKGETYVFGPPLRHIRILLL